MLYLGRCLNMVPWHNQILHILRNVLYIVLYSEHSYVTAKQFCFLVNWNQSDTSMRCITYKYILFVLYVHFLFPVSRKESITVFILKLCDCDCDFDFFWLNDHWLIDTIYHWIYSFLAHPMELHPRLAVEILRLHFLHQNNVTMPQK